MPCATRRRAARQQQAGSEMSVRDHYMMYLGYCVCCKSCFKLLGILCLAAAVVGILLFYKGMPTQEFSPVKILVSKSSVPSRRSACSYTPLSSRAESKAASRAASRTTSRAGSKEECGPESKAKFREERREEPKGDCAEVRSSTSSAESKDRVVTEPCKVPSSCASDCPKGNCDKCGKNKLSTSCEKEPKTKSSKKEKKSKANAEVRCLKYKLLKQH